LSNKIELRCPTEENTAITTAPRTIIRRIGHTTYKVNIHFSRTSRQTLNDKIIRLIRNEASGKAAGV